LELPGWVAGDVSPDVVGANIGPDITQTSGDTSPASHPGSSKMLIQNIVFANWTGWTQPSGSGFTQGGVALNETAAISCSTLFPCQGIIFQNVSLSYGENGTADGPLGTCTFAAENGIIGMDGTGC